MAACVACAAISGSFSVFFFTRDKYSWAVWMLVLCAFSIRLLVAALDPYLHDWDERFHAAVAKNMIADPFKPVLRQTPVEPYNYKQWWTNYIWMHKPPLFLWQMAASLWLFGVNEIALRLPSVMMGSIATALTFRIVRIWSGDAVTAFVAALLATFSFYWIELASGRYSLDHNDLAFSFYVTASIWSFCEYYNKRRLHWVLLTGLFVGCAVLCKWLPGLLALGGWGVLLLWERFSKRRLYDAMIATAGAALVAFPWQVYIWVRFPAETAFEWKSMHRHFYEVMDLRGGEWWFHLAESKLLYGAYICWLIPLGLIAAFASKRVDKKLTVVFAAWCAVVYVFYSSAATKMPAFTFLLSGVVFGFIALSITTVYGALRQHRLVANAVLITLVAVCVAFSWRPWDIVQFRSPDNTERNVKIHNTRVMKLVPDSVVNRYVIYNCKGFEELDMMFYRGGIANRWSSTEQRIDSLIEQGVRVAAFPSDPEHELPAYMNRKEVLILPYELK